MTGAELAALRESKGWSQTRLAQALEVPQSTVSRWETGAHPIDRRTAIAIRCVLEHGPAPG